MPKSRGHWKNRGMAQDANNGGLKIRGLKTDDIFLMVNDPLRRAIIRSLADGSMKVSADLGGPSGGRRHNKLKHIAALCKAGILVQKENPKDARTPLYALSPIVDVRREDNMLIVDFGRYRMRLD